MAKNTLLATELGQLNNLSQIQAALYCQMSLPTFRKFVQRRNIPYALKDPYNPRSHRIFKRRMLDQALDADMNDVTSGLDEHAANRVQQILGESK